MKLLKKKITVLMILSAGKSTGDDPYEHRGWERDSVELVTIMYKSLNPSTL